MASGRVAGPRRPGRPGPGRLFVLLGATAVVLVAVGGCATVPSSATPQPLEGNSGQQQAFVQPLPPPGPEATWTQKDVIDGFLHASASFELDPSAAQQYLAPGVRWKPGAVTVVSSFSAQRSPSPVLAVRTGGTEAQTWVVTGQRLASLSSSGQYINQPGTTPKYEFTVARYGSTWRIQSIEPKTAGAAGTPLLLLQGDFQKVFQPRNLYFFSQKPSGSYNGPSYLVPDPVFVPVQGANSQLSTTALATRLVKGLMNGLQSDPAGWLSEAAITSFPDQTRLISVSIDNLTATVDLGGTAEYWPQSTKFQMYAQLRQTLTSTAYNAPQIADSVRLEFDGNALSPGNRRYSVPAVGNPDEPLYFASDGVIDEKSGTGKPLPVTLAGQAGSPGSITAMAISRGARPQLAVAVPYAEGCAFEVLTPGGTALYHAHPLSRVGGPCTSLSWDSNGNLWAAAGSRVWVMQPHHAAAQVALPSFGPGLATPTVVALRMAADSVRAALLVHTAGGNRLFLAGVSYSPVVSFGPAVPIGTTGTTGGAGAGDLSDPKAVSWFNADYLAVVDGSELYQVPLTGGPAQPLQQVQTGTASISSNGQGFVISTPDGQILTSPGPESGWQPVAQGILPAYPG